LSSAQGRSRGSTVRGGGKRKKKKKRKKERGKKRKGRKGFGLRAEKLIHILPVFSLVSAFHGAEVACPTRHGRGGEGGVEGGEKKKRGEGKREGVVVRCAGHFQVRTKLMSYADCVRRGGGIAGRFLKGRGKKKRKEKKGEGKGEGVNVMPVAHFHYVGG